MKKGPKPVPVIGRIFAKVQITKSCWNWLGGTNGKGYGVVLDEGPARKMVYVHRKVFETFVGEISEGLQIDHLCKNTSCCNPRHLEVVTCAENLLRSSNKNFITKATGVCQRGHSQEEFGLKRKNGRMYCSECKNASRRKETK